MAERFQIDRHGAEPILAALQDFMRFPVEQLAGALTCTSTWPSTPLCDAINGPVKFAKQGTVTRREALRAALFKAGRSIDAEDIDRRLQTVRHAALAWDEDASRAMEWNTSTIRMRNFERRQKGLPEVEPTPHDLFGEALADRHNELVDLAEDAARGLRALVLSVVPEVPKGKPGRPEKRPGLAQLAAEMWTAGATHKEIAKCWNAAHPESKKKADERSVRGVIRRLKNKQQVPGQKLPKKNRR